MMTQTAIPIPAGLERRVEDYDLITGYSHCIAAPPAIVNAVLDALSPLGITVIDMPLKPEKVWTLIQQAQQGTLKPPQVTPPAAFEADKATTERGRVDFA